jgi:hypothetical protein
MNVLFTELFVQAWERALKPCFPAAAAEVVLLPLIEAVARCESRIRELRSHLHCHAPTFL